MSVNTPARTTAPVTRRRGRESRGSLSQQRRRLFVPFVGPALAFYTVLFVVLPVARGGLLTLGMGK